MRKHLLAALLLIAACAALITGCSANTATNSSNEAQASDDHLTVYLWQNTLLDELVPYLEQQLGDTDIEFVVGNNNVDLYNYLQEHGSLPDVITTRRFSSVDARDLQPYLLDFSSYDISSEFSSYALQYYRNAEGNIQWLPICGIPETTIVNKTLLDKLGLSIPESYSEFAQLCDALDAAGVKPYACELSADWACHSVLQGAAIDQFESIEGIRWRSTAESAQDSIPFDDEALWNSVFNETATFISDTHLGPQDVTATIDDARQQFVSGEAAMFRGTPEVMDGLKSKMSDELVRLPYFSQTSNESWVYTYASLNVALSKQLESKPEKLDEAMKLIECLISEQGQKIIANGTGLVSYNSNVPSQLEGLEGIEDELAENQVYIRYASNNSFTASLAAVQGLASGTMDAGQAYEAFKSALDDTRTEDAVATFDATYTLSQDASGGRDAASAILTTARQAQGTDLALAAYSYFTSPIYEGACTKTQLTMMTAQNDGTPLYTANLTGAQVKALVENYLATGGGRFAITNRFQLPIASGMKLSVAEQSDGTFALSGITVDGQPIDEAASYSVLLTKGPSEALANIQPAAQAQKIDGTTLSKTWVGAITSGQQPAAPEDYIALER